MSIIGVIIVPSSMMIIIIGEINFPIIMLMIIIGVIIIVGIIIPPIHELRIVLLL